ncbi:hypothetical protein MTO96_011396 [Rhipicephalus appendiculatus]
MPLTKKFVLAVQVFVLAIAGTPTSCDVCLGPFVINASSDTRPQSRSTFTPGMLDNPLQDLRMSVTSYATDSIKPLPQNFFTSGHGEMAATMPLTKKFVLAVQVFLLAIAGTPTSCDVCLGPFVINASSDTRPQSRSTFTPGMLDNPQDLRTSVTSYATDSIKPLPQNFRARRNGCDHAANQEIRSRCAGFPASDRRHTNFVRRVPWILRDQRKLRHTAAIKINIHARHVGQPSSRSAHVRDIIRHGQYKTTTSELHQWARRNGCDHAANQEIRSRCAGFPASDRRHTNFVRRVPWTLRDQRKLRHTAAIKINIHARHVGQPSSRSAHVRDIIRHGQYKTTTSELLHQWARRNGCDHAAKKEIRSRCAGQLFFLWH